MGGSDTVIEGGLSLSPERRALLERMLTTAGVEPRPEAAAPRIPRRDPARPAALSYAQQRLWFMDQLAPNSPFYNVPVATRLEGPLNPRALQQALNELVRRHEVLRTSFPVVDGYPVQRVAPEASVPLPVIDLSGYAPDARRDEAQRMANAEARRPFNLQGGPVIRARLLRLAEGEHWLLLTLHHIAADGWSMGVLSRELGTLYRDFAAGQTPSLPELPLQYADFAVWQRAWLTGEVLERQVDYWRRQLADLPALRLVTDHPRGPEPTFEGGFHPLRVGAETAAGVRDLAAREGATPFMVLLAAFATLLYRYTGQDDVVVGSPIANRTHRELEGLIGFFVNTLVLRADLSGQPTFRGLVGRVRRMALDAFAHQDVPFEKLVEELQPDRDLSRNPLFQVGFVLQTAWGLDQGARAPTATVGGGQPEVQRGTAIFDLAMHLWEGEDGIGGGIEYSTALFEASTVARLGEHFATLLEALALEPDARVGDVALLRPHERHRLLVGWNRTAAPFERDACLHQLFEAHARRHPEAEAVRFEGETTSYGALNARANRLAHLLRARGVGPGVPVLLCLERSVEMVAALLAVLKAGGAWVPLDPGHPPERLRLVMDDTRAPLALTQRALAGTLAAAGPEDGAPAAICVDGLGDELDAAPPVHDPAPLAGPGDLAYVIYTSGSTGRPKGVMVEHRGLCNVAAAQQRVLGAGPDARVLQFASLTFDAGAFEVTLALAAGGTLCLAGGRLLPGPALVELLRRERVTHVVLPPSALAALPHEPLPHLTTVTVAGEACPEDLVARWAPGRSFFNLYGPTEATIWSTWARCEPGRRPPIGRPVQNTRVYVLDACGEPAPTGVPGEIWLGGVGLARGYLNRPELTAERFVTLAPGGGDPERLYRTGDLGRWLPDGELEFLGRTDHQVKVRGFRIEPEEIETTLAAHPSLQEAVVTVREDTPGDRRLVAYVTPAHDLAAVDERTARELSGEQVSYWRGVYDDVYGGDGDTAPEQDFTGWNSSYTGEPLPRAEMHEWLDATVERILSLRPRRVLEVGCGSGLVLFPVAPRCEAYTASDFSAPAVEAVRRRLAGRAELAGRVRLEVRHADDFGWVEPGAHDLVVLNSVVQYFPSADYLRSVLAGAVNAVGERGAVFVGDVRDLALLETFALSVELARTDDDLAAHVLRERVRRRLMLEQELVVDPDFFHALRAELPRLRGVEVLVKRGRAHNELTRFRYDVVLHVGDAPAAVEPAAPPGGAAEPWSDRVRAVLSVGGRPAVHLAGIPSARVAADLAARAALAEAGPTLAAGAVRARAAEAGGVDPEAVAALGESLGWRVELHASEARGAGAFDAVFRRAEDGGADGRGPVPARPEPAGRAKPWAHYTSNPLRGLFLRTMVPRIRAFLEARLPDYLVPAQYVLLERIPRTTSGKADRARLPAPDRARPDLGVEYVAPTLEVERVLAAIWSEVLGVERVGVHDNFFELGGDSILGIQIVARARAAGLELTPAHLFEHQTIAELVAVCAAGRSAGEEQGPVSGPVPLTPVQHWFFEQELAEPHHFNQALLLPLREPLDPLHLRECVRHLCHHHDALRLRFERAEDGWVQHCDPPGGPVPFGVVDLAAVPPAGREAAKEEAIARAQGTFDLAAGPLLRVVLLRAAPPGAGLLLLAAHHLVVDAVSWRILLEDLRTAYGQLSRGEPVELPPRSTSFPRWAGLVQRWAAQPALLREAAYWTSVSGVGLRPLPVDEPAGANTVESLRTVAVTLGPADTGVLLQQAAERFRARMNEVLLAALARAVAEWTGQAAVLVDVEGHGREEAFERADLSRTVGWFTSIAPLRLDLGAVRGAAELLASVKEQVRAVPNRGIGYGVLRYLCPDPEVRRAMAELPQPGIAFNYLGRSGQQGDVAGDEQPSPGPTRGARNLRRHLLEINAQVLNGTLTAAFHYSAALHRRETVARLADGFLAALREIAAAAGEDGAARYTASDFSRARLNPEDFGKLMERLAGRKGDAP